MKNARRYQLDELILSPGTYFNPQTEITVIVDDSAEIDNEIFEAADLEASDWIQLAEDTPLDEHKRDEIVERFQLANAPGGELGDGDDAGDDDEEDDDEDEEDDDLEGVEELEL